ncbi:hypothetical protein AB835_03895 [Candidatus Endobugula sertula]|uniref:Baseplate J-like central domain-containing protein n=1 Tax=Candidatus Endobugula sertula TaxID=62101 RepID=A0A1D2QS87_9GAMM|nr:hypothetical protein AB835_03895 [Candidatus Endobugula sertula]
MSLFTTIDLSKLPPPSIVEKLDYETLLAATKTELQSLAPELAVNGLPESDPISKLLQIVAYREMHLRQRINEAARGVMLATASGSNLDNLAALVNIIRLQTDPGDPNASPPVPPTYEDDERLRTRTQLAFEGFSTAGPKGAYIFHALSASALVKDVSVYSESPGIVDVRILSKKGNGHASSNLVDTVNTTLNDDKIRPITDQVRVNSAEIVPFTVNASLQMFSGVGAQDVLNAAKTVVQSFLNQHHGIGVDITRAGLFAAFYQPGVQNVELHQPATDLLIERYQAPYGTLGTINYWEQPYSSPSNMAVGIVFTNSATTSGHISGTATITAAIEDHDITHYVLYWGANNAEKLPRGSKNYTFMENTNTFTLDHHPVASLSITSNDGNIIYIKDKDYRLNNAIGVVTAVNRALDNTQVSVRYALPPIVEIAKGGTLTYHFVDDTKIPARATHLIVFTKNEFGEMRNGVSVKI